MPSTNEPIDELLQQARELLKKRQMTKALELYEQALQIDSRSVPALEGMAAVLFLLKEYDRAIEMYTKITRIDPRKPDPHINIGAVQNKKGDYAQAVKTLRMALSKDRRSATAYYNLGIAHRGANQQSMAVSAYKEAIRLAPEMPEAYYNLGNLLLEMGNHTQADLNFRRALELNPKFEKARQGLARAQDRSDEAKKSISPFGRLVDTEALAKNSSQATVKLRELSPQERFDDRSAVHKLAKESEQRAAALLNQLRDEISPVLLDLARLMTEDKPPQSWVADSERLKLSMEKFDSLLKLFAVPIDQLEEHEKTIRAPGS